MSTIDSDVIDQHHQMGDITNNIDTGGLASLHTQNLSYRALELHQRLELLGGSQANNMITANSAHEFTM